MPISDEALQNAKNKFIAVSGDATVGQAIAAFQVQDGQPWWHLLVQMDDGSWGVTRFADLYVSLERMADAADVRLGGWKGLKPATAVEQDSIETKAGQSLAGKSPGSMLVVTVDGMPVGILVEGVSHGGLSITSAKLGELGGKYVDLKDYGSILLSSSSGTANPTKS
jgi:hypothetical protein